MRSLALGWWILSAPVLLAQEFSVDDHTLFLGHFNDSTLAAARGVLPVRSTGTVLATGKFQSGVSIPAGAVLNYDASGINGRSAGTIEFWIRPEWAGPDRVDRPFLTMGSLRIVKDVFDNLRFLIGADDSEAYRAYSLAGWQNGVWHHIAVTWTVPGQMNTYIDGVLRISHASQASDQPSSSTAVLSVGNYFGQGQLMSTIDELRITDNARSAQEIAGDYTAGLVLTSIRVSIPFSVLYPTWRAVPEVLGDGPAGAGMILPLSSVALSVSDPQVATIDAGGKVVARGAGTAILTARLGSLAASTRIEVIAAARAPDVVVNPPGLADAPANSLYQLPVVIISFLPTVDGNTLDVSFAPDFYSLNPVPVPTVRAGIADMNRRLKWMKEEATRFRGYKDPQALPSLGYKVMADITVYEQVPPGRPVYFNTVGADNTAGFAYAADLPAIFERFGIDRYINELGVKEVWLWFGFADPVFPSYNPAVNTPEKFRLLWESQMSSSVTGNVSNSNQDEPPPLNRGYIMYSYNIRRLIGQSPVFTHNDGHQLEAMFIHVNARDSDPNMFWEKFMGRFGPDRYTTGRCGWTHMPPNTTVHYDYHNATLVLSDCEDWTPAGTGARKLVNDNTFGSLPYSWPPGLYPLTPVERTEAQWFLYWMQNMPGLGNRIPHSGTKVMRNWWQFVGAWDVANQARLGLYDEPLDYTVAPAVQSVPREGGPVTIAVSGSGGTWIASSNAVWIRILSTPYGRGPRSVELRVDANPGPQRQATVVVADRIVTITQAAAPSGGSPPPAPQRFAAVTPCRVADTRLPNGPFGGPSFTAGGRRDFAIPQSGCRIPSTAQAYSLNVTVVPKGALGYLTAWPAGQAQPLVSTLNSLDGRIVANAAIVPAGTGGAISIIVTDPSDVVVDINGYFEPASAAATLQFYPVTPCRVADTRLTTGPLGGPILEGGASRDFAIPASACGINGSAQAYSLNVTAVPVGPLGYLTAWPAGQARPLVSTLNSPQGAIVANAALVPAGTNGAVSVFVTDRSHVVIDINGFFGPPSASGLQFYPVTPCRVMDTRNPTDPLGGPGLGAAASRTVPVRQSACSLPSSSQAYSLNATVVPAAGLGYLTLWPAGQAQPLVSTLNSLAGAIVANAALVPAGASGAVAAFATDATHLVLDINGYFAP